MNLFVIIIDYIVDLKIIDKHRQNHLKFLDKYYNLNIFIVSGARNPRDGGIIIAKAQDKNYLSSIIKEDPFYQHNLAKFSIHEFYASKYSKEFEKSYIAS